MPSSIFNVNDIGNKDKRTAILRAQRLEKNKAKSATSAKRKRMEEELGDAAPPRAIPRTIENTRTLDETTVAADDAEVLADEASDEFAAIFSGALAPKVMVTTARFPSAKVFPLIGALLNVIPQAFYYRRRHFALKNISHWAAERGFTHLIVVAERGKVASTLLVSRLRASGGGGESSGASASDDAARVEVSALGGSAGPTAAFRFSSPQLPNEIEGHGTRSDHLPEIILNNFTTRLGRRFGRLVGSLWPHTPAFRGRQVITLHNQRDFIFFRHHRYIFDDKGANATLQELGPRFTLKPLWLLAGGFDPKEGEFEWRKPSKANDEAASTRRSFLL
jgi:ribosome production factor 1